MAERAGPIRPRESASLVPGWRAEDFLRFMTDFLTEGVVQSVGNQLSVAENSAGANMTVQVETGRALVEITNTLATPTATHKTWYSNDAVKTLNVSAADSTNARIDRVILKYDDTVDPDVVAANVINLKILEGTPAASPVAPTVPDNAISLAQYDVAAGATSVTDSDITDERAFVQLQSTVLQNTARVDTLSSVTNGKGASTIGVEDSADDFTGTDVESVLGELQANFVAASPLIKAGDGSDGSKTVSTNENLNPANEYDYSNLTIDATNTLSVTAENDPLIIRVTNNVTINGTIDLDGMGGEGGTGTNDQSKATDGEDGNSKITGFVNTGGIGGSWDSGASRGRSGHWLASCCHMP